MNLNEINEINEINKTTDIPHIIHQIWFQGESVIPEKYRAFRKTWKDQDTFRYEFWDEERICNLMDFFPEYRATYISFPTMIQKIDFAKYVILYVYGGAYIDMDVFAVADLSSFLHTQSNMSFIVFQHNTPSITITVNKFMGLDGNKIINNAVIFCTSRNERMVSIIETCQNAQANWRKNWLSLQLRCLVTTGPIVFTNCIRKMDGWKSCVLPCEIFEPFTTLDMMKMSEKCTHKENGFVNYDDLMSFFRNSQPIPTTVGIHVLDLNWFKNGKENWKFKAFKKMQKIPMMKAIKV